MLFEHERAHESDDSRVIRENAHHVGPALDLSVEPLERVRRGDLGPVLAREAHVHEHVLPRAVHQVSEGGEALPQGIGDRGPLLSGGFGCLLGEDRLQQGHDRRTLLRLHATLLQGSHGWHPGPDRGSRAALRLTRDARLALQAEPGPTLPHPGAEAQGHELARYDESLRRRGSLMVWFSDEAVEAWEAERRTGRGGQPEFSDLAILTALTFKAVFRLAYRQTEGLIGSVIGLLGLDLAVPDHTTLCRRAETLEVPRPKPRGDGAGGGAGGDT